MIPRRLFADVWELLFRTKRTFRTFFEKVHFSAPKRPKCSSPYVFPGQINGLGREKCTFLEKSALFAHFPLWAPKSHANSSTKQRAGVVILKTVNFLLQSALWEPLGHLGPGWLLRAQSPEPGPPRPPSQPPSEPHSTPTAEPPHTHSYHRRWVIW